MHMRSDEAGLGAGERLVRRMGDRTLLMDALRDDTDGERELISERVAAARYAAFLKTATGQAILHL